MIGEYVHTEVDCRRSRITPSSVGMGSYNMDSHNCARYVTPEGYVQNEGDVQESPGGPYQISYLSMVPKGKECSNLLVPVCLSSSHIAYGSIRMEPVFMVLGQSAATAAVLAIDDKVPVQQVAYDKLQKRLLADKQVLDFQRPKDTRSINRTTLAGIIVDDEEAVATGTWSASSSIGPYLDKGYRHDGNADKGQKTLRFTPKLDQAGKYEVVFHYVPASNRATNTVVVIQSADGTKTVKVNQKQDKLGGVSLGTFQFEAGTKGWVEVRNENSDGYVVADAVRWVLVK
ncbi:MAG: FAD-dependent oxidoreductase [Gemmatales bacterium]